LRHAYATHSRESIENLRQLMGHISIETTSGYRHPNLTHSTNPLDDLQAVSFPPPMETQPSLPTRIDGGELAFKPA